jgi:hypothetical protein
VGPSGRTQQPPSRGSAASALKQRIIADDGRSLAAKSRGRRWETLLGHFPDLRSMAVVDLGGTPEFWRWAPIRPRHVVCVNPFSRASDEDGDEPWLTTVRADACCVSDIGTFDLAFSNSTIEHVGGHARRLDFARSVRTLSAHYWVQTPYRYFPVEPHFLFPCMQFLPTRQQALIAERWPLSNCGVHRGTDAVNMVLWVDLLSITDMRHYFPDATMLRERVLGITKSIIAVR